MRWVLALLAALLIGLIGQTSTADMKIAFASNRDGNFEIYVMDTDGRNPVRLTNNSASDSGPTWSSDGKRIAFTSNPVMNANGSRLVNLTQNHLVNDRNPSWQPIPQLPVSPQKKLVVLWGQVKQNQMK